MKILLPVYGKQDGKLIIDFVANYSWPPGIQMKVIHVLGSSPDQEAERTARQTAEELISWFRGRLSSLVTAAELSSEILSGSANYEIVKLAGDWQANMIVMGYRTREDIKTVLAGSVSRGVVIDAPCSVVVLRPPVDVLNERITKQPVSSSKD